MHFGLCVSVCASMFTSMQMSVSVFTCMLYVRMSEIMWVHVCPFICAYGHVCLSLCVIVLVCVFVGGRAGGLC